MKDYIVRATAANGQIRAFAATTKQVVETARCDHNTSPVEALCILWKKWKAVTEETIRWWE